MTTLARLASPVAGVARLPLLAPLRLRDFRLAWFGESVSLLGDQFHLVALSWLVLGLTGSGLALGTVLFAAAVPRGVFVLIGGVLSDRISPRRLMLWSNLIRAVVTTVIAALALGAGSRSGSSSSPAWRSGRSWAQARTEPRLLGRTMSFLMFGGVVGAPVSVAVAGAVVDLDATALFLAAGGLVVATAMAGLASGLPRRMV